jgi:hypothetical protein
MTGPNWIQVAVLLAVIAVVIGLEIHSLIKKYFGKKEDL